MSAHPERVPRTPSRHPARAHGWLVVGVLGATLALGAGPAVAAPPPNDAVAGAVLIDSLPRHVGAQLGEATVDPDDASTASCHATPAVASVWYRFVAPASGFVQAWPTEDGPFHAAMARGTPGALTLFACFAEGRATVVAGETYYIQVAATAGDPPQGVVGWELVDGACVGAQNDYDGDGCADLAVGSPASTVDGLTGAGRVEVSYGNGYATFGKSRETLAARGPDLDPQPGQAFGAALASGDLNTDGYTDLVVGVPGYDLGTRADAGIVQVYFGGPEGLDGPASGPDSLFQGVRPGTGAREAGDRFGSAVDVEGNQLLVGVPGEDVGRVADAGAVVRFGFGQTGLTGRLLSQGTAPVPGTPEAGDAFGSAVVLGEGTAVIGAPGEDIGVLRDAGAAIIVPPRGGGSFVSQDSPGMPARAEVGDRFGSAVAYLHAFMDVPRIAIGAPGEDLGTIRDAGLVNLVRLEDGRFRPEPLAVTQDTPGAPGRAEAGDRFGGVLGRWTELHAQLLVVGVPDEDVGSAVDAGLVAVLGVGSVAVRGVAYTQASSKVNGTPESGDRFGAAVTTVGLMPIPGEFEEGREDHVFVGVPGEDVDGVRDVGLVQGVQGGYATIWSTVEQPGARFGATLSRRS